MRVSTQLLIFITEFFYDYGPLGVLGGAALILIVIVSILVYRHYKNKPTSTPEHTDRYITAIRPLYVM